jgi:hypothetical protein
MLHYEVTIRVPENLRGAWDAYIPGHVADVFATGCFQSAVIWRSDDGVYQCAYAVASRADLDRYMSEFAPAMRADTATRFPGLEIGRAIWSEWKRMG